MEAACNSEIRDFCHFPATESNEQERSGDADTRHMIDSTVDFGVVSLTTVARLFRSQLTHS